ncbi:hypothetical protein F5888DRAFT_1112100 [Russula emetica]|nr:hypothetical protein F5888DRAFT_1112100 [Russula emetica]
MLNADVILQSSDLVNFRVHRSVLATSSPFFSDMFSLPQPPNGTAPDELPVVHVSEDSVVLNSLISMLYPVPPEMPNSSDDSLALVAAAAKYKMDTVRSSIRAEITRKKLFSSSRAGLFRVYAVAYKRKLIPEMAMAARLTLSHPLTFKSLGDTLRLFKGCALRDLADFRRRSIDKFLLLLDCDMPSNIWAGCPTAAGNNGDEISLFLGLCDEYLKALRTHIKQTTCQFCMKAHAMEGEMLRTNLKGVTKKAWSVPHPMQGE